MLQIYTETSLTILKSILMQDCKTIPFSIRAQIHFIIYVQDFLCAYIECEKMEQYSKALKKFLNKM